MKESKVGPVELATISFGQRFEVTPIQMVKMVGTIANKGIPVTPRLVKATIDSETRRKTRYRSIARRKGYIRKDGRRCFKYDGNCSRGRDR